MKGKQNRLFGVIALVLAMAVVGNVYGATLQVGVGETYTTIQAAIDAASPGDIVNVGAGVYNEHNITINKSLTLTGDPGDAQPGPGADAPIVDGQNLWSDGFLLSNGVSNVIIQGFEIRNYFGTGTGAGNAIQAWVGSTNHITVNDNYMHNLSWNGVLVGSDKSADPAKWGDNSYWTIARNILTDFGPNAFDASGYGFELTNTSHGVIEDNVIDSGTGHFPGTGILIQMRRPLGQDILLQRNIVRGQYDFAGINVQASTQDVSSSNLDDVRILNNDVNISGPAPALKIRNKLNGTVTGVVVHDNKLIKTSGYGLANDTVQMLNAENNWWGSAIGPGALVNGTVDFDPWYIDGEMLNLSNAVAGADDIAVATADPPPFVNVSAGVTVDISDAVGTGTIITSAYVADPITTTTFSDALPGNVAMKFVEVKVEGLTGGIAVITVYYTHAELNAKNLDENMLILYVWYAGAWHAPISSPGLDVVNDKVWGTFNVTDLTGAPAAPGGPTVGAIPTLSEWGFIIFGFLIFIGAVWSIRRQRYANIA